jgi:glycosyltransferase involved in cell wall biosynthesis
VRAVDDVDLLLVGDGALKSDLTELSHTLGIDTRIRFMGIRDDVSAILAASDVFALTSLSEAASITLLEAMASAVPVVVTDVGGNPEMVRHGVDGLLVPRGDVQAAATALIRILRDRRTARAFGVAAMRRVRQHYRLDRTVARYYELYAGDRDLSRAH